MKHLAMIALAALVSGCGDSRRWDEGYTLYRTSITEETRVHVASFDTNNGTDYNFQNCQIARNLFQEQPGVQVHYWCEKGRYIE